MCDDLKYTTNNYQKHINNSMERPIQTLDEDITCTLNKLHTLLEYSTKPNAEEALLLIERARQIWGEDLKDDSNWECKNCE